MRFRGLIPQDCFGPLFATGLKMATGGWFCGHGGNTAHFLWDTALCEKKKMTVQKSLEVLLPRSKTRPSQNELVSMNPMNQPNFNDGLEGLDLQLIDQSHIPFFRGTTQTAPSKEGEISHVCTSDQASILERMNPSSGNVCLEDDHNFMVCTKRILKANEYIKPLPIMDRHENNTQLSMGNCSKAAPGVNVQEEDLEDTDLVKLLRSSLSKSSLDSLSSMSSEEWDYRCAEVKGDLVFSLDFDDHARIFSVFIKECHNLADGHFCKRHTNPYVKCYLLPWRCPHNKRRTSIKYNTVNPTFNENLKFTICRSQLVMRTLLLSVWHHDILNHDKFLGEVELPLDCRDLGSPHEECVALRGKVTAHMLPSVSVFARHKGQLAFSLKYLTTDLQSAYGMKADSFLKKKRRGEGELHVCIKEAKNLVSVGAGCRLDSFVKGYLLQAKNMADKRKTPVVRMSMNPQYNHTFIYKDLGQEQLKKLSLELTVWKHEIMSRNHFLGGICLNSGTAERSGTTEEVRLWQMMMQYPDSWVEGTVPLCSYIGHNNNGKSFFERVPKGRMIRPAEDMSDV